MFDPVMDALAKDTRDRIVAEAERLFRHYGYGKTTIADLAGELGMSPANIYRFFPSKAAIHEAVTDQILSARVARTAAIKRGPGSASARLREMMLANHAMSIDLLNDEKKVHEMVAVAMGERWDIVKDHIGQIVTMMAEVIGEGVRSGEFQPQNPELSSRCLHQAFMAYVHPLMVADCVSAPDPIPAEQMVDFLLTSLRSGGGFTPAS